MSFIANTRIQTRLPPPINQQNQEQVSFKYIYSKNNLFHAINRKKH